jgi:hypothetical protein
VSVATIAVVCPEEAERVSTPVAARLQSSPPVRASVVEALVLPIAITSAAVPSVAMLIVSVPEFVTPPISIALVLALSPKLIPPVPVSRLEL